MGRPDMARSSLGRIPVPTAAAIGLLVVAYAAPARAADDLALEIGDMTIDLRRVPKGAFLQGSPATDTMRDPDEASRSVTLTHDFWLGKTPVTRGQFARFVTETHYVTEAEKGQAGGTGWDGKILVYKKDFTWKTPGFAQKDDEPVVLVTFGDANAFTAWLARKTGRRVRLPTEAEWEYAARAGSTTAWYGASREEDAFALGWFAKNAGNGTRAVGQKKPNALGLLDMTGNVFEWCRDVYAPYTPGNAVDPDNGSATGDEKRVLRGGSWVREPRRGRSSARHRAAPGARSAENGFRIAIHDEDNLTPSLGSPGSDLAPAVPPSLGSSAPPSTTPLALADASAPVAPVSASRIRDVPEGSSWSLALAPLASAGLVALWLLVRRRAHGGQGEPERPSVPPSSADTSGRYGVMGVASAARIAAAYPSSMHVPAHSSAPPASHTPSDHLAAAPTPSGHLASASPAPSGHLAAAPAPSGHLAAAPSPSGHLAAAPSPSGHLAAAPSPSGHLAAAPAPSGHLASAPTPEGHLSAPPPPPPPASARESSGQIGLPYAPVVRESSGRIGLPSKPPPPVPTESIEELEPEALESQPSLPASSPDVAAEAKAPLAPRPPAVPSIENEPVRDRAPSIEPEAIEPTTDEATVPIVPQKIQSVGEIVAAPVVPAAPASGVLPPAVPSSPASAPLPPAVPSSPASAPLPPAVPSSPGSAPRPSASVPRPSASSPVVPPAPSSAGASSADAPGSSPGVPKPPPSGASLLAATTPSVEPPKSAPNVAGSDAKSVATLIFPALDPEAAARLVDAAPASTPAVVEPVTPEASAPQITPATASEAPQSTAADASTASSPTAPDASPVSDDAKREDSAATKPAADAAAPASGSPTGEDT